MAGVRAAACRERRHAAAGIARKQFSPTSGAGRARILHRTTVTNGLASVDEVSQTGLAFADLCLLYRV
jgi:hypothetical protein